MAKAKRTAPRKTRVKVSRKAQPAKTATRPKAKGKERKKPDLMLALRDFVRARAEDFLKDKNVTSVGVGYKSKGGEPTKELAIQFSVARKAQPEELESLGTNMIPASFEIAGVKVPTDVIERKFNIEYRVIAEISSNARKIRQDPVMPGVSVANARETAGTIGCIVYDARDSTPYILSNWHVLHGPSGQIGDTICQPGPYDDNRSSENIVGRLVRSHLGVAGDGAICTIENRNFDPKIFELGIDVAAVGEPELGDKVIKSGRTSNVTHGIVTRIHTITKIDYGGTVGERQIGGFEIGPDKANPSDNGEISMGGDSGSAWLFKSSSGKPKNVLAGLHFAGEGAGDPNEHAIACYPNSIFEKLEIRPAPSSKIQSIAGRGYDPEFLGETIMHPALTPASLRNCYKRNGSEIIDYTHFSLALNKLRRFAAWVAWNVDGNGLRKLSRTGIPFIIDPDIPAEFQTGDDLYAGNRLDRGHIARRADLLWGPMEEAKQANVDSFFLTNITPQMDDFNQSKLGGLWGKLEDALFSDVEVEGLKISVFGGPVFRDDDRVYRNTPLPREYWKVIAFLQGGQLKSKGFLLSQSLDELEALDLAEFKVYQVGLAEIEKRCELSFPQVLKAADSVGEKIANKLEVLALRKPLTGPADIDWS